MKNVNELSKMGMDIITEANDLTIDEVRQFEDIFLDAVRNSPRYADALFKLVCKSYYAGYYLGANSK